MLKRIVGVGLILGWAACALSGCGSGSSKPKTTLPTGTVIILIGDSPACDVLAFRPTISKLTFTPQGGGNEVPIIQSTTSFVPAIKVNFAGMRDSETVLATATVGAEAFEAATLTLTSPVLTVFDPTQTNLFKTLNVKMTTSTPRGAIVPPLQVKAKTVSVLRLDFDLLQSIGVDASGDVTGTVTPTFHGTAVTASGSGALAEVNGLRGFVERVDTVGQSSSFTGDILVEVLEGSGPSVLVNLAGGTKPTKLIGVPALNQVPTGSYVEVEGFIDSNGNFVANTIEVEDREVVEQNKLAFIGYVTSVTKDASGNLSQFNFYVHEEEPDSGFFVPLDTVVVVKVSSSTGYCPSPSCPLSSASANFANLPFNPAAIVPGLELVVHGTFSVPPRPASPTVAADKIYLKLQTVQGSLSLSSPPQIGSDDKTGAFYLAPCPRLIQGVQVLVVTNNQTAFVNVVGLSELTPQATLLIKGLPFFEPTATTVNGVAVPVGTLVLLAQEVRQLS